MTELSSSTKAFMSPEEAQSRAAVYAEKYGSDMPYFVEHCVGEQRAMFAGIYHTADPGDSMLVKAVACWPNFMQTPGDKIALYEGAGRRLNTALSFEESVQQEGDPGAVLYLAAKSQVLTMCPEPSFEQEIKAMHQQFSEEELLAFYTVRQYGQWHRQEQELSPDWRTPVGKKLAEIARSGIWSDDLSIDQALEAIRSTLGVDISGEMPTQVDLQKLADFVDPATSHISRASGQIRDQHILNSIKQEWDQGRSIFAIYGIGHVITLEEQLRKLN